MSMIIAAEVLKREIAGKWPLSALSLLCPTCDLRSILIVTNEAVLIGLNCVSIMRPPRQSVSSLLRISNHPLL